MEISQQRLCQALGTSAKSLGSYMEKLGISDFSKITEQQMDDLVGLVNETKMEKAEVKAKQEKAKSSGFKPKVRRIDKKSSSSVRDMLQDCKERYVANERIIQRLQFEIDQQDSLMHGLRNGTISCLPQLSTIEKFQKVNITLRSQIVTLEAELGVNAKDESEDDPFS